VISADRRGLSEIALSLNHLDYVDKEVRDSACLTIKTRNFVKKVEADIDQQIEWLETGPAAI
jgi:hypothetical protein